VWPLVAANLAGLLVPEELARRDRNGLFGLRAREDVDGDPGGVLKGDAVAELGSLGEAAPDRAADEAG
jgi:hypothetical protein